MCLAKDGHPCRSLGERAIDDWLGAHGLDHDVSKDAVSRLVGRLSEDFNTWRECDLSCDDIRYIYLDGWYPKVRIGKKRERVPVLVVLGVRADGQRVILDMCMAGEESCASWSELIDRLEKRHMNAPLLAVIDGNAGLEAALRKQWPTIEIQRCTAHKLRSLQSKAPSRMREELAEDYRRMIYAENRQAVEQQRQRFTKKWKLLCPAVIDSFNEAGLAAVAERGTVRRIYCRRGL